MNHQVSNSCLVFWLGIWSLEVDDLRENPHWNGNHHIAKNGEPLGRYKLSFRTDEGYGFLR